MHYYGQATSADTPLVLRKKTVGRLHQTYLNFLMVPGKAKCWNPRLLMCCTRREGGKKGKKKKEIHFLRRHI